MRYICIYGVCDTYVYIIKYAIHLYQSSMRYISIYQVRLYISSMCYMCIYRLCDTKVYIIKYAIHMDDSSTFVLIKYSVYIEYAIQLCI